ncbi:UDP-D-galactose:(glucosyl)lipopolysaccharide-1,6-D-galactosyltransferase [Thermoplasmatales archaeon]|nr:UDP-D-galactose:(glucosyl)lipopolysaccharide-1,6-D-galactosyltransferase [Thermoplasmatales archaeon]
MTAMNKGKNSLSFKIRSGEQTSINSDPTFFSDKNFVIINWRDILNPKAGGAERYCYEMARRLASDGIKVTWITSGFEGAPSQEYHEGIKILRVGNVFTVYLAMIGKFIRNRKNSYILESVNAIPFLSAMLSRKNKTVMIHHLIPYSVFREKLGFLAPVAYFLQNVLNPVLYRKARVITNSESTKKELLDQGYRDVNIVKTGVDSGFYKPTIKMDYIVAPGPLRPWKNHSDILTAHSILPDNFHLFIFGAAESEGYLQLLKAKAISLGTRERVHFLGKISDDEKRKLFSISKLSFGASVKEGWGLSNMESQSFGCPVVAYDVPGVRDSVRNYVTGRLVEFGNITALASSATELLTNSSLLNQYSERSISWSRNFQWQECYRDFLNATVTYGRKLKAEAPENRFDLFARLRAR